MTELTVGSDGLSTRVIVCDELRAALGIPELDWNASFFENGGDSLMFIIFVSQLSNELSSDILRAQINGMQPLSKLLEAVTAHIERNPPSAIQEGTDEADLQGLAEVRITANRYSYLDPMGDQVDQWVVQSPVYAAVKPLRSGELERICKLLSLRHDGLRLAVERVDGKFRQRISSRVMPLWMGEIDSRGDDALLAQKLAALWCELRSDIGLGDPIRLAAVEDKATGTQYLAFIFHHVLLDSIGLRSLEHDFFSLVDSRGAEGSPFTTPAPSYRVFCEEYYRRCTRLAEEAAGHWSALPWEMVRDLPKEFQVDPAAHSHAHSVEVVRSFPNHLFDLAARRLSEGARISITTLIVASMGIAYAEWSGDPYMLLELSHHSRPSEGTLDGINTVGWVNDTVPLIIDGRTSDGAIDDARAQMGLLGRLGAAYSYCRHLAPQLLGPDHARFRRSDLSLNLLIAANDPPPTPPGLSVTNLSCMPMIGERVHAISGGAVRDSRKFRLSLDFDVRAFAPGAVDRLLDLWADAFCQAVSDLSSVDLRAGRDVPHRTTYVAGQAHS